MSAVVEARDAFEQAKVDAKKLVDAARASFGQSIKTARDRDKLSQDKIAKRLGLTREQVRRYERYYEDWLKQSTDSNGTHQATAPSDSAPDSSS